MEFHDFTQFALQEEEDFCTALDLDLLGGEDFDFGLGCDDDDADGDEQPTGKEVTGRWTREEHLLFIKGLEMYGKGWKKIAGLIKTRTVVQIRTHAQKYFLKLTKARQNGDSSGLALDCKGFGPGFRKKAKKRRSDRPIAVAPPLQPFVKPGKDAENPVDIDGTLYQFLSPDIGTVSTHPSAADLELVAATSDGSSGQVTSSGDMPIMSPPPVAAAAAPVDSSMPPPLPPTYTGVNKLSNAKSVASSLDAVATAAVENNSKMPTPLGEIAIVPSNGAGGLHASVSCPQLNRSSSSGSVTTFSGVTMVERLRLSEKERSLPAWYSTGAHVTSLLKEAEDLDWSLDIPTFANTILNGSAMSISNSSNNNKSNSNPYFQYLLPTAAASTVGQEAKQQQQQQHMVPNVVPGRTVTHPTAQNSSPSHQQAQTRPPAAATAATATAVLVSSPSQKRVRIQESASTLTKDTAPMYAGVDGVAAASDSYNIYSNIKYPIADPTSFSTISMHQQSQQPHSNHHNHLLQERQQPHSNHHNHLLQERQQPHSHHHNHLLQERQQTVDSSPPSVFAVCGLQRSVGQKSSFSATEKDNKPTSLASMSNDTCTTTSAATEGVEGEATVSLTPERVESPPSWTGIASANAATTNAASSSHIVSVESSPNPANTEITAKTSTTADAPMTCV